MTVGRVNPAHRLEVQGITGLGEVFYNLREPALIEQALKRHEGTLGQGGAFLVTTGKHTGRSPKDAPRRSRIRSGGTTTSRWRLTPSTGSMPT